MKSFLSIIFVVAVMFTLGGCSNSSTEEATANSIQPDQPANANPAPTTPAKSSAPKTTNRDASPPPAAKVFQVPEGTSFSVTLLDDLNSGKNKAGDLFLATLADSILVNGEQVLGRGVKVQGRVIDAEGSGRVKGRAKMSLALTNILDGEKQYPISTSDFSAEAEGTKGRDAGIIGGAAGIGAAIGALTGGKEGAAKGALIGGAAGTGTVLVTKGKEVEFGPETKLKFTLDKSASVPKIAPKSF